MKKVMVQFRNNQKEYVYITAFAHEVGDMVVVESPHDGLVVVAVSRIEVTEEESKRGTKHIVCCVDVAAHEQRLESDQRIHELRVSIAQRAKAAAELKIITDLLGADDEELKELTDLEEQAASGYALVGEVVCD